MFTVFDVLTDVLPYFDRINVFKTLIPVSATKNPRIRTAVTLVLLPISEYGAARSQGNQSEQERSNGNDKKDLHETLKLFPRLRLLRHPLHEMCHDIPLQAPEVFSISWVCANMI